MTGMSRAAGSRSTRHPPKKLVAVALACLADEDSLESDLERWAWEILGLVRSKMSKKPFPFPLEEDVRRVRLQQLFLARYPNKPTTNDAFAFFGWLLGHYPNLVPREKHGDPYQQLQSDLHDLYD
jgi:hypothetical protein